MPAVAVTGDESCTKATLKIGEGAVIRMIRQSESLPYAIV